MVNASTSIARIDSDLNGSQDLVLGRQSRLAINQSAPIHGALRLAIYGKDGLENQYGRSIFVSPESNQKIIQTVVIDGGSGWTSQSEYAWSLPLAEDGLQTVWIGNKNGNGIRDYSIFTTSSFEINFIVGDAGKSPRIIAKYLETFAPPSTLSAASLVGNRGDDSVTGSRGRDSISGQGGSDTLSGEQGDDVLVQAASVLNGAAGSMLDGGAGNDRINLNASQAYTATVVSLMGGEGDDTIRAGTRRGQYVGAVRIEGGIGNDVIETGHIEGSGNLGYLDGGSGNDTIRVVDTWGGTGIWSNSKFDIRGGEGNDRFELAGTQYNVLGTGEGAQIIGGAGLDTLVWNGSYNLTINGDENPALTPYEGYRRELKVSNVEVVDLDGSGVKGLGVRLTAQDVAAITAGSDFNRASLGMGLSGVGNVLLLNAGANTVDMAGWSALGSAMVGGQEYGLHQSGTSYLGVNI